MSQTNIQPRGVFAANDATARLERQLSAAQQITHIGSWEWDFATSAVTWSDELYRIYGLEPQSCDISFERFLSMLHPDDRARVQGEVQRAIESGARFAYPERIVRPDGSIRHLHTVGEVVKDESGRAVGLIGTCRDVTEQHERDELLGVYENIVRNVQIGLTVWQLGPDCDPLSATLVAFNAAAERLAGVALAAARGKTAFELFPALAGSELIAVVADVARRQVERELPAYRFNTTPGDFRTFSIKVFPLASGCVGLAIDNITAQTSARRLQAAEQHILEMIAAGRPLELILSAIVEMIEEQAPAAIGSVLLLDETGTRVRHGAAPRLPAEYCRAIDGSEIGPNAGSCGTAMYLRRAVITDDIETDPNWKAYRDLARPHGLRACWSLPILTVDGRVLGSFALYYTKPGEPSERELHLIQRATHVAGIAIERKQLDDQLRALFAHLENVREDERSSIAREIHDDLGQALTALKMDVAWIARRLRTGQPSAEAAVLLAKLQEMERMTDETIDCVRRISTELRPGVLDDLGLLAAIEWQSQEFERRTGCTCRVSSNLGDVRLPRELSTALFRIFQESLTNVARHAAAERVDVRLVIEDGLLLLTVRDDGKGIASEALRNPRSLGLLGMSERARRVGGSVTIVGGPDSGTLVRVEVPLPAPAPAPGSRS